MVLCGGRRQNPFALLIPVLKLDGLARSRLHGERRTRRTVAMRLHWQPRASCFVATRCSAPWWCSGRAGCHSADASRVRLSRSSLVNVVTTCKSTRHVFCNFEPSASLAPGLSKAHSCATTGVNISHAPPSAGVWPPGWVGSRDRDMHVRARAPALTGPWTASASPPFAGPPPRRPPPLPPWTASPSPRPSWRRHWPSLRSP